MRRYAWRRDAQTADDVAAETFVVAWRRLDEVPTDARPWLIGVARNVRLNLRRSQRRQQNLVSHLREVDARAPIAEVARDDLSEDLHSALLGLSPADREVLLLHAWDDLETAQIAIALQCSKANASVRLHRAKRRFEKALERAALPVAENDRSSTATPEGAVNGC